MANSQAGSRTANGVPPASHAKSQPQAGAGTSSRAGKGKTPVEGQKVVLRRLPPGITEQETVAFLSDEWKPGGAKVGWFSFQAGKISKDPAKPSRPSRAYLHVLKTDQVMALVEHVRNTEWLDAKDTSASSCLVGPPVLDISIYKKVPSSKVRADARAGTIDQDPEFMDFLEALANPNKDPEADHTAEEDDRQITKASSTPLIDYLREKKANKAKESAASKSGKHSRHDSGTGKGKSSEDSKKRSKESKTEKSTEKPRENVKILTKKAAVEAAADAANAAVSQIMANSKEKEELTKSGRRAGIAAAARILQRDLGLSPGNAHRRARQEAAKAENEAKGSASSSAAKDTPPAKETIKAAAAASTPTVSEAPTTAGQPPTPTAPKAAAGSSSRGSRGKKGAAGEKEKGGREKKGTTTDKSGEASVAATLKAPVAILKKKDREENKQDAASPISIANASSEGKATATTTNLTSATTKATPNGVKASQGKGAASSGRKGRGEGSSNSTPNINPAATRAFVKHANPSQGVTEALLKEAMQAFGNVTFVEMDKRKGFAYIDFADHDSLVRAITASPVSVAQATVQVLERKEKDAASKKGGGGGGKESTTATPSLLSKSNDGGKGVNGPGSVSTSGPKSTPTGPKAEAGASSATRSATPPTGPAADEDKAGGEHKRGGRRRGGRGRGGEPKEGASSKAANAGAGATSTSAAPSAAS
ncbi:hypothetical protein MAPG_08366 [Magnaporthiopsis poae ATCC 64411]|uniref:RRM domain-containing protein n=1 Tax=Magnaporthiopsis poae (strain ATCC 64411 / 73-15) TaxID=644358 RepID=A0A0C4E764_MAGP6|nr:hypothetical protein MAPG_08366 [Magnaporthiopsis poae ATCC 64411]